MKILLIFLAFVSSVYADTPPSSTVKSKTFSGDGLTAITATGTSLNVNVTNSGGGNLVSQGAAGLDPWAVHVTASELPVNACMEEGGYLQSINTKLASSVAVTGTFWQTTQPVSGTFWQTTQPVSAASLPLPSGAATSLKQPAFGTAGTPSADVLSVQGTTSMTPLKVDGSGVTQPVSGTFWQDTQPVSGTFWQAVQPVSGTFWQATQPVSGTFWQATQPVSAVSLPLPTGAATNSTVAGLQVTQGSTSSGQSGPLTQGAVTTAAPSYSTGQTDPLSLTTSGALRVDGSGTTQPVSGTFWQATQPVSGTFWQATQPVSAAALPLPSGAATEAKQPALGTAGSASSDVLSVQGITSMTPLKVDGSGVTQPVSGTFWQATQPVSGTFWQATQPVSLATLPALVAGSAIIGKVSIDQTTPGTTNLVALAANQSVNTAQINGVTPLMGNGATGTGSQRVTIASDNTAFSVNAIPKTPAAVTVKQAALSIGTSAVRLTNDGSAPPSTRVLLVAQLISTSTASCYFGSSGVTTTSTTRGVQMFAGQTFSFSNDAGDYYAICDASAQTVFVTEQE